jgi:hypothetical protein
MAFPDLKNTIARNPQVSTRHFSFFEQVKIAGILKNNPSFLSGGKRKGFRSYES